MGVPYNGSEQNGDATNLPINVDALGGLEVDMNSGDVYYAGGSSIYLFDVSEKSKLNLLKNISFQINKIEELNLSGFLSNLYK